MLSTNTLARLAIVSGFAALAWRAATDRWQPDPFGPVIAQYEQVAPVLPARGRIGLLPAVADPLKSAGVAYMAQYALVPRLLDQNLVDVSVIVTTPGATDAVDRDPRVAGFRLVGTFPGDIRVYRHE